MAYIDGKLATATEKVLLYLSRYQSYKDELEAPMEITQIGISETIGVSRGNIPRAIHPLIEKELVLTHKVHVPGIRLKRNAYYLSETGRNKAKELKNQLLMLEIDFIDLDGKKTKMQISEVLNSPPSEIGLIDILRNANRETFDYQFFLKNKTMAERRFLGKAEGLSKPKNFFGRSKEAEIMLGWFESTSAKTLVINGMPGIGKTCFASKMLVECPHNCDIYLFRIRQWSSVRSLLVSMSEFLVGYEMRDLKGHLESNDIIDLAEVEYILNKGLREKQLLLVYDDFHNSNMEILRFFSMLHKLIEELDGIKMIVIGRVVEPFYDRRDALIDKKAIEITLGGLDRHSTLALAEAVGVPRDTLNHIHERTNGHPLFVELLSHGGKNEEVDIERFIVEEFTNLLKSSELEALKQLSVYRYPVQRRAMRSFQPALSRLFEQSIVTLYENDFINLHDIIKNALYRQLSEKELKRYHTKAAEYYLESSTIGSQIEALTHLLETGDIDNAIEILLEKEENILKSGRMEEIARILTILLSKRVPLNPSIKARVLYLQSTALSFIGEWDDAIKHYKLTIELTDESKMEPIQMKSNMGIAKILLKRNEYDESKAHFEKVLDWAMRNKDKEMAAEVNYQLGSLYEREMDLERALKHFRGALRISTELNDRHQLAKAHYGLGRIYHRKHKFEKALESKNKALDIALKIGDEHTAAKILTSIGGTLDELGRLDEEIEVHEKAIELARKNGAVFVLGYALSNAGAAYIDKPDLITSSKYLHEALDLFEKLGEKRMVATIKLNMAIVTALKGKNEEAKGLFKESTGILEQLKDKNELIISFFKYGQTLSKLERSEEAHELFKKALSLSQEIENVAASEQILQEIENLD